MSNSTPIRFTSVLNNPPPAPKKGHTQYYTGNNWVHVMKEDSLTDNPPPAPMKGYTQYFDNNKQKWVYVKSNSIRSLEIDFSRAEISPECDRCGGEKIYCGSGCVNDNYS